MHELGLVFEMARVIEESLAGEDVTAVDTVVMEIGEVSSVVPHYFESCFPAARQRPLDRMPVHSPGPGRAAYPLRFLNTHSKSNPM